MWDLAVVVVIFSAIWVYFDSKALGARRGLLPGISDMGPLGWAASTALLWLFVFPYYITRRQAIKAAAHSTPARRRSPITGR